jgi:hypothetical protein
MVPVVVRAKLVESDQIRVVYLGRGPEFLLELVQGGGAEVAEHLQRNGSLPRSVERLVHDADAALTQTRNQLVPRAVLPARG